MNVFIRTLDKQIETKVESSLDEVIKSSLKNPKNMKKEIIDYATDITLQKDIDIIAKDIEFAQRVTDKTNKELRYVKSLRKTIFESVSPKQVNGNINSNLSVDLDWSSVPESESYRIYWSSSEYGYLDRSNSEKTNNTSLEVWPEEFPKYYRITAIKGNWESRPSKAHKIFLLSDEGGSKCQICGNPSIGRCHLRHIYVCNEHNVFTQRTGGRIRCP